jgi:hypothetical protein
VEQQPGSTGRQRATRATSTTTPTKTTETTIPAKPIARWLGKNRYSVSSRTTPRCIHEIDTYHLTCTCPAGQWSKRCWALGLVLSYEHWRKNEIGTALRYARTG